MEIKPQKFDDVKRLARPELWITKYGLVVLIILSLSVAVATAGLIQFHEDSSDFLQSDFALIFIRLVYILGLPAVVTFFWFIASQWYLRSGSGVKVGIVDNLDLEQVRDWSDAREQLVELAKEGKLKEQVCLRLVPRSSVITPNRRNRFIDRYCFGFIIEIRGVVERKDEIQFRVLNDEVFKDEWISATMSHLKHVLLNQKGKVSPEDISKFIARNIHEAIIWLSAARLVSMNRVDEAIPLLLELDKWLATSFSTTERPRHQVRWLIKVAYMVPCAFKLTEVQPSPDEIDYLLERCTQAEDFDPNDPGICLQKARLEFLANKLDLAIASVERAEKLNPNSYLTTILHLNKGFLSLIKSEFINAADSFGRMLDSPELYKIHFHDLVVFSDLVDSWGYSHVIFIRDLYRRLANGKVDKDISSKSSKWLHEDESRSKLIRILNRAVGVHKRMNSQPNTVNKPKNLRRRRPKKRKRR